MVDASKKKFLFFPHPPAGGAVDAKILKFRLIYDDWGAVDAVRHIGAAKKAPFCVGPPESEISQEKASTAPPNRAFLLVQVRMSTAPHPELV